ncbi:MAG: hypothetical protein R3D55_02140 [Chloroflexota bacterium]
MSKAHPHAARKTSARCKKLARERVAQAAFTGQAIDLHDVAQARGLVLRERDNSIFSDAWIPLALLFLIIGLTAGRHGAMLALGLAALLIVGVSTVWKTCRCWASPTSAASTATGSSPANRSK